MGISIVQCRIPSRYTESGKQLGPFLQPCFNRLVIIHLPLAHFPPTILTHFPPVNEPFPPYVWHFYPPKNEPFPPFPIYQKPQKLKVKVIEMKSEAIKMIHTYAIIGSVVYSPLKLKLLITKYQIKQGQALGKIANRITPEHHQQSSAPILKDTIFPLHILKKHCFLSFNLCLAWWESPITITCFILISFDN